MDFTKAVSIFIASELSTSMVDTLMVSPYAVTQTGSVNVRKVESAACRALR
jgi:hypothetical protein